ncbi:quinon protein alcohol dehydrogenase-like superfamily [Baffinella frigidus]|nr:quinon protein alcohol dehydrogenase-like superfamily [Cryptophyta sp. CCMP2293]
METGMEVRTLAGFGGISVAISTDGKRVVSGSDYDIEIWDMETGAKVRTLATGHSSQVSSLAISADGKRVVSGSYFKSTVKIWDMETGAVVRTLKIHLNVSSVAISADGKRVICSNRTFKKSDDAIVQMWDVETGAERVWFRTGSEVGADWQVRTLAGHSSAVTLLVISADGKRVVSSSEGSGLKIWDVKTGAEVGSLADRGRDVNVCSVAISADGKRIVSGSSDATVKIWDVETGAKVWTSRTHDCKAGCTCTIRYYNDGVSYHDAEEFQRNPDCPLAGHWGAVVERLVFYCRTTSARTSPHTPRRTCCPTHM